MTEAQAKKRVKIRKYMGDDAYSWALFIDGRPTYSGMDRSEATWRRNEKIKEMTDGRS